MSKKLADSTGQLVVSSTKCIVTAYVALYPTSVSKSEVKALVSLVIGGSQILVSFSRTHRLPSLSPRIITPFIIPFDGDNQNCIPRDETKNDLVALSI